MTKYNKKIVKNIIKYYKKNYSQERICQEVGISRMTLHNWLYDAEEYQEQSKYYSLLLQWKLVKSQKKIKKLENESEKRKNFKPRTEEEYYQHYFDDPHYFTTLHSYAQHNNLSVKDISEKDMIDFYKHILFAGAKKPYLTLYDLYLLEDEDLKKGRKLKAVFNEEDLNQMYEEYCYRYPDYLIIK